MDVVYAKLPASSIFNACDPALLWNVAVEYGDVWWSEDLDSLREILRDTFIEEFDKLTGHYTNLRKSIDEHGIKDPIVVTAGKPIWREQWMIPDYAGDYICESCGGSRLMIAKEKNMDVPCVINDGIGVSGIRLRNAAEVLNMFSSKTYTINYGPPCRVTPFRFSHMDRNYTMGVQQKWRRQAKERQIKAWKRWKEQNTRECGV